MLFSKISRRIVLTLLKKALYEFGCFKEKVWSFLKFWIWQRCYFTEFPWDDFACVAALVILFLTVAIIWNAKILWQWNTAVFWQKSDQGYFRFRCLSKYSCLTTFIGRFCGRGDRYLDWRAILGCASNWHFQGAKK